MHAYTRKTKIYKCISLFDTFIFEFYCWHGLQIRAIGYINPNSNPSIFNGVHVRNKDFHTWVEGMSEREFLEEVSLLHSKGANLTFDANGRKIISSYFSDGCPVKLYVEKQITINGVIRHDYVTTILLNTKF